MKKEKDTPTQISSDYDSVMETLSQVEVAFAKRGLKCHSGSALGSLFASIRRIVKNSAKLGEREWQDLFIKSTGAIRILKAVEAVLDDAGAKEAIHRITTSDMNLDTRKSSNGKDALWELDLYRRLKMGGIPIRVEEPDLVISLGENYGEYAIACKKIWSVRSLKVRLKQGSDQLKTHKKPGVIALNLDDILPKASFFAFPTEAELKQHIDEFNSRFVKENEHHFVSIMNRGGCDGVLVSTSLIAKVPDLNLPMNLVRSSASWTNRKEPNVQERFKAFVECHDRICHAVSD